MRVARIVADCLTNPVAEIKVSARSSDKQAKPAAKGEKLMVTSMDLYAALADAWIAVECNKGVMSAFMQSLYGRNAELYAQTQAHLREMGCNQLAPIAEQIIALQTAGKVRAAFDLLARGVEAELRARNS